MGNQLDQGCQNICGFNLITSADLRKTSLHKDSFVKPTITTQNTGLPSSAILDHNSSLEQHVKERSKSPMSTPIRSCDTKKNVHFTFKEVKEKPDLTEYDFKIIQILADGRYGRVCAVKLDRSEEMYTMKIICKKRVGNEPENGTFLVEKEILEKAHHPFIPKLLYSFENQRKFYLVMEYLEGGELHKILNKLNRFSEEITRFYAMEVILALEYLHQELNTVYNNLEPENILLDREGHLRLTDFDLSKKINNNSPILASPISSTSKDILHSPQSEKSWKNPTAFLNDYWKLGYFLYELITGIKPFKYGEESLAELERGTLEKGLHWPKFVSKPARDLIERLLNPQIEQRLGFNGIEEIKNHKFFTGFSWEKVLQKAIYPPLNPTQFKEHYQQELEEEEEDEEESEEMDHFPLESKHHQNENKIDKGNFLTVLSSSMPHNNFRDRSPGGTHLPRSS